MKKIIIRNDGTKRVLTVNEEPSKTDQSWAKDCDVNEIISRFKKTGQITHLARKTGVYADVTGITDLMTSLLTVEKANTAFMSLPAAARKRFNNDPQSMIEFLQDPANNEEAVKLGLKEARPSTDKDVGPIYQSAENKAKGRVSPKEKKNESDSQKNSIPDSQSDT